MTSICLHVLGKKKTFFFDSYLFFRMFCLKILSGSSEAEEENDPDGPFAFRRKAGCQYYAVSVLYNILNIDIQE